MIKVPPAPEDALDLAQHRVVLVVMLDGLEADHDVDRGVRKWDRHAVADRELKIGTVVAPPRMCDGVGRDVDADDAVGDLREHGAAVAFTARDVEHTPAAALFAGQQVAMHVLEPDVAGHLRHVALAGPWQLVLVVSGRRSCSLVPHHRAPTIRPQNRAGLFGTIETPAARR